VLQLELLAEPLEGKAAELDHPPATTTQEMLMLAFSYEFIMGMPFSKLQLLDQTEIPEKAQIPVNRGKTYTRTDLPGLPIKLIGIQMTPRLPEKPEKYLPLPGPATLIDSGFHFQ